MTSSNVIEYIIFDKELNEVGRHRQNIMCHTNNDGLEKFRPFSDFTIFTGCKYTTFFVESFKLIFLFDKNVVYLLL